MLPHTGAKLSPSRWGGGVNGCRPGCHITGIPVSQEKIKTLNVTQKGVYSMVASSSKFRKCSLTAFRSHKSLNCLNLLDKRSLAFPVAALILPFTEKK